MFLIFPFVCHSLPFITSIFHISPLLLLFFRCHFLMFLLAFLFFSITTFFLLHLSSSVTPVFLLFPFFLFSFFTFSHFHPVSLFLFPPFQSFFFLLFPFSSFLFTYFPFSYFPYFPFSYSPILSSFQFPFSSLFFLRFLLNFFHDKYFSSLSLLLSLTFLFFTYMIFPNVSCPFLSVYSLNLRFPSFHHHLLILPSFPFRSSSWCPFISPSFSSLAICSTFSCFLLSFRIFFPISLYCYSFMSLQTTYFFIFLSFPFPYCSYFHYSFSVVHLFPGQVLFYTNPFFLSSPHPASLISSHSFVDPNKHHCISIHPSHHFDVYPLVSFPSSFSFTISKVSEVWRIVSNMIIIFASLNDTKKLCIPS